MNDPDSTVPETPELLPEGRLVADGGPLTLKQLHQGLDARGVKMSYSALSEFLSWDDIAQQLDAGGAGNRREFPSVTVDTLARFWPAWKESGGRKPNAAAFLRRFVAAGSDVSGTPNQIGLAVRESLKLIEAREQGRAQGLAMQEEVLTASEAAAFLKITTRMLRMTIPPWRRFGKDTSGDRWLRSQLLAVSGFQEPKNSP